jgi:GntR family transcriptional regulator/MocR family aminotransferase
MVDQLIQTRPLSFRLGAREIYGRLRDQIVDGVYACGEEIPSTRALAKDLGVARTTICIAYEQLGAEGYIVSRQGARPRVAFRSARRPDAPDEIVTRLPSRLPLSRFGHHADAIDPPPQAPTRELPYNFRYGEIAGQDFPASLWRRALISSAKRTSRALSYGDPQGSMTLRRALQGYLWRARSINCDIDQIIIVSGSQQALDLLARLLLDPGDSFVIENPCYLMARLAFEATGATAIPIDVDEVGLRTQQLATVRAKLAYVTPSHQYPIGGVLPINRRLDLVQWSQRHDAWIVEDDYDSEYRYDVKPLPPLCALNTQDRVIYVGTVSKTLSPALRIGYVVVPSVLQRAFTAAKRLTDRHSALHDQEALADLILSGAYERHVQRQRRLNHRRRKSLIDALHSRFGATIDIEGTEAGLHVVVWFKTVAASRERALIDKARALGVGLYSVRPLCDPNRPMPRPDHVGLVMGYAALDPLQIERGVDLLRKVVDGLGKEG